MSRENYLMNGKFSSSFVARHQLAELDRHVDNLGRLSKSSKMLNTNQFEKSSSKNCKASRDRKILPLDKPLSSRKLKNDDCHHQQLSKSAHNLHRSHLNSNCMNGHMNDHLTDRLNGHLNDHQLDQNDSFQAACQKQINQISNQSVSANNLLSRLMQMENQVECQSAKLFNFEKKIEDLNRENDELTQTLLANRASNAREGRESSDKSCNFPIMNLKSEIFTIKERLNSQILVNSKLEKENIKLADKLQHQQSKLAESEEKYETLIAMKNRELDDHKLRIENLSCELGRKEEECNQLELDKQHLCNKVSMLNQVTDKQDEKIEQHNSQLDQLEQKIENLKKQIDCKDTENEKLRKELILVKNSMKKVQNLNQTNENLIIWLNKQLTDSQSRYNLLYPKPKKSTSINLNQRPADYDSNLSEALSDSHLFGHHQASHRFNLDDFRNDYCRNEFMRSDFKNEFGDYKGDYKSDYKSEYKNDYRVSRQLNGNCANLRSNLDRRLDCQSDYALLNRGESKGNYLPSTGLYGNKRLNECESFKCTLGK